MKYFADANFLVGLYDPSDQYAKEAPRILQSTRNENPIIVMSDYIYDETMTFLLKTHPYHGYVRAKAFDEDVFKKEVFELIFLSNTLFHAARDIFHRYNTDKRWSFTDCTSYVIMEDYGINRVLTFDDHFSEMGFTVVR